MRDPVRLLLVRRIVPLAIKPLAIKQTMELSLVQKDDSAEVEERRTCKLEIFFGVE